MKIMLSKDESGKLTVYVPKKDLEEAVVEETNTPEGKVVTLANGWELCLEDYNEESGLPQTIKAKKLN